MRSICQYRFITSSDSKIVLHCADSQFSHGINLDNEQRTRKDVTIPGAIEAFAMIPNEGNANTTVFWETDKYVFLLSGDIDYMELLRMARSIVENPPAETDS